MARTSGNRSILARRTVLRGMLTGGLSVAVPLPRLCAMLNGNGTAYAAGGPLPVRFGTWFFGNGIIPTRWVPLRTGVGEAWALSEQLSPLAAVKSHVSIVTGLNIKGADTAAHMSHPVQALTGAQTTGGSVVQLPTIDHVIGTTIGKGTIFPNGLHVGIGGTGGGTSQGINVSYRGPSAPNPPILDPAAIFAQLVKYASDGGPPKSIDPELLRRRMVLDAIRDDATSLRGRLGKDDQQRLDQHLSGLQQLQTQIMQAEVPRMTGTLADPAKVYPRRGADGSINRQRGQAFSDLLAFALSSDLTRTFSYEFTSPACHGRYDDCGLQPVSFHEDYGHRTSPRGFVQATEGFNTGVKFAMTCLADTLVRFKNTPDGAGNLLDNTCVFSTSCVSESPTHGGVDFPTLVTGKAGGKLKGDQHIRLVGDNVSKVPFTLLTAMGVPAPSFGAGASMATSGIPELLA